MDSRRKLALYIAYYLARFNKQAYLKLGYGTMNETHREIGEILDVKQTTIKQMRDEFDPLFGNRAGWHQKKMIVSRAKVAAALDGLEENEVFSIVKNILNRDIQDTDTIEVLLDVAGTSTKKKDAYPFIVRGPTGRLAEELFMHYYNINGVPIRGKLIDTRDLGTGYDFEIQSETGSVFIEVKGIAEIKGGVLFTGKEWETARRLKKSYYLCLVSGISTNQKISLICDPVSKLQPKENIFTTIQVTWSVSSRQLSEYIENGL
jgi:hypothetical protein